MLTVNGVIFNPLNINDIAWNMKSSEGGKIKCNTKCNIPGCYTFPDLTNRPPFFRKNARKTLKIQIVTNVTFRRLLHFFGSLRLLSA